MYDLEFIRHECGFGDLPGDIDIRRLFNVSYEMGSGRIKLYVLDESERFLHKIDGDNITRHYAGDDAEGGGDFARLCAYLDCGLDPRQIVIDAVEEETYYLYLDDAGVAQTKKLLTALCRRRSITESQLLAAAGRVAAGRYENLVDACVDKAVSGLRVPLDDGFVKVYGRPFLKGRDVQLDADCVRFLEKLFAGAGQPWQSRMQHSWLAEEIPTGRTVLVTQHHQLLHR